MTKQEIILKSFSIGLPKTMTYENDRLLETGICKESVDEALLTKDGFSGDGVANLKHHGGPDRAVCVYPYEHYALWEKEFGTSLPASAFGENITVTNMLESDICIGDIYQLGDAVVQIAQGRVPCSTINKRTGLPTLMNCMVDTGLTGYFCRVLKEGKVRSDSKITLIEKDPKEISILWANEVYFQRPTDIEAMQTLLSVEALADKWKGYMTKRLSKFTTA
ncbi:MOSC domain-containing protein [Ureibacillus aquaedulcis]|uniref:MOSC domain-containing protein n=1 Tax=Ureibacillus aquaedulcis TaxID=3058421 RepID=A0ABT8GR90_9BACL|nr:MOSC domain-containing protein [Ureibacillus sp. BA0131]MDN4493466.1 MOSC domain-containing protein [Ureibacillus sp. BA0131]